ncbi:alginate export family protein [Methylophilus medardicus]|uniref:Alginate export family protein n=1 Tax=Methylophilus medardicus TaxID=2588534 RepID=A0A5B8CT22_9PROT|nr:alginate export family protein [Methylophilus medardicus]QDC44437.1 alginate export family protein [Methylophilus medardicus]QDC49444.1 alginate export family protein [Methylophilus medardicus]QDC53149.1 alginate export family protein [Methylophilus medardicus]
MQLKKISLALATAGLWWLGNGVAFAEEAVQAEAQVEDTEQQKKVKARLAEIKAEEKAAAKAAAGYYVERRSYGTQKETEPPRYVKQLNKTWLKDYDAFADVDWLDIGFEYRARFEHRDNDFRRAQQNIDEPLLLRSRAYVGLKNILDPFRFAVEVQDSRRNHSDYTRSNDTRDVDKADFLQAYLELYFKDSIFGKDDLGNSRPFWVRGGRLAWEAVDRRLIARNEWRNTTNTFQGVRANIGDKKNDWQLEVFGVQPVQRFTDQLDQVDHSQNFYGAIFDWRGLSEYVSIQPYYFLLKQDGSEVKYDANGNSYSDRSVYTAAQQNQAKIDREIHTAGLRVFGVVPGTSWDYDASYIKQWGHQDRFISNTIGYREVDHDAHAYNAEIGYTFNHLWKPRVSAFYGVATGDRTTPSGNDFTANQRFDRLFGFARPWSNDDYIQMENIRTPKVRLEFDPKFTWLENVKVDTGFSWYRLDSASDRWNAGANLRDRTGNSGKDLGKEFDLRVRFPLNQYASLNLGYAHFWAGDFVKNTVQLPANNNDATRSSESDFFYTELTLLGF